MDVEIPLAGFDADLAYSKVEYYNGSDRFLLFDSSPQSGSLRFFHVVKFDPDRYDPSEAADELHDLFDCPCTSHLLTPSEMTLDHQRSLTIIRQLMFGNHAYGTSRLLWNSFDRQGIHALVDGWIGFTAFKFFFRELSQYCDNTVALRGRANFNVVLLNDHGIDEEPFVEAIYHLYAAHGLIRDFSIIRGNLSDAILTKKTTPFLYHIVDDWELVDCDGPMVTRMIVDDDIRLLFKRETIYVTCMTKEQWIKAQRNTHFRSLFPRCVALDDLTYEEKAIELVRMAGEYGFTLDPPAELDDRFVQGLEQLRAELSVVLNRRLAKPPGSSRIIRWDELSLEAVPAKQIDALRELETMIGLKEVKTKIREITNYLKLRGKDSFPCLHMVFKGNPGTGKTTVARLIGQIFSEAGILSGRNVFVEADREDLVGMFVGHTAVQTAEKVREALGGVLFIDEAYSLALYDRGLDFGEEALATLVKKMEDHRKDFVCILAGYPEEMDRMIDRNPGLRDRIQFDIDFPDYSADELMDIFLNYCLSETYELEPAGQRALMKYFELLILHKQANFANARLVRKIFERTKMKQALSGTDSVIIADHIHQVFQEKDLQDLIRPASMTSTIGFRI